jgi:EmrB/QacA subfamily drug resistance transporter
MDKNSSLADGAAAMTEKRRWWALAALSLASFLLLVDDTAVAVALPAIGRDLGLGLSGLEWVVNVYTLVLAVLILSGGTLADRLGTRRVLLLGLAVFTAASLAAAFSASGTWLLATRGLQGAGAALMAPATLSAVSTTFPPARRGLALGIWSGVSAAALALGPLVGALLSQSLGWRSIFLVNVPLGAALVVSVVLTMPASPGTSRKARLDLAALGASAAGLSALVFGLTQANSYGWTSARLWAVLALAAGALALFVWIERRSAAPMLDLALFRARNFAGANAVGLLSLSVMCSIFFFVSLYLQLALGYSPIGAGSALLPLTLVIVLVSPLSGRLVDRIGAGAPMAAGMALLAVGLLLLSRLEADTGLSGLLPGLAVGGLGIGSRRRRSPPPSSTPCRQPNPASAPAP